jgi:hypothetical protein
MTFKENFMNANRALGLLAAILVTTGQALVLATDTAATAQSPEDTTRHAAPLDAATTADAQRAHSESRGLIGS